MRAWALSEWALVPLRLFLGATFIYAGLQKLANPNFFNALSPISIQSQLTAAAHTSPLGSLLTHLAHVATAVGLLIALGEVAVGIGTLLGLWSRVAALGGLVISLSLFLTVSFHASPFFTGADIVFFFAWLPLLIAGGGTKLSLDALLAKTAARRARRPSPELVAIPFATVQSLCGNYDSGTCRARGGLACDAGACPVLLGRRTPLGAPPSGDTLDRRTFALGATAATVVGASVLLLGGAAAETGRLIGDAPKPKKVRQLTLSTDPTTTTTPATTTTTQPRRTTSTTSTPTTTTTQPHRTSPTTTTPTTTTTGAPAPSGTLIGAASQVPDNDAANFTIPSDGEPGIVIHTTSGQFVGYNAVCPHMGCTVGYSSVSKVIVCPCHGSQFEVSNGDVIVGPAPHGLTKLNIVEGGNGNLYLQ